MWAFFPGAIALLGSVFLIMLRNRTKKPIKSSPEPSREKQSLPVKDEPGVYKSGLLLSDDEKVIEKVFPEIHTIWDVFNRGLKESKDGPCVGTRQDGHYHFRKYSEVLKESTDFASAIIGELETKPGTKLILLLFS
ncbi:unnamed protein product [Haemonchus placei]|uniref:Alpha/beta hydrolase n=1 Tax=Haemonchus placei TaxID=6290 RepID=A0A0N4VWC0_HAEPC|nr:unnamed protein product [Haemonchus placei]